MKHEWIFISTSDCFGGQGRIVPRKAAVKLLKLVGNEAVWISYNYVLVGSHWDMEDRLRHINSHIEAARKDKKKLSTVDTE